MGGKRMKTYNAKEFLMQRVKANKPILAYDEKLDHDVWKSQAEEKLKELLGLPLAKCEDCFEITEQRVMADCERIEFEFQSEEGYWIPCTMLKPLGQTKPLPTVICLQGHSTGKHVSLGEYIYEGDETPPGMDHARLAVKAGYCAVAMDQRYMGRTEQDAKGNPGCITYNTALMAAMMGRTAIGERVWDVQRLIDVLETYMTDVVNKDRIVCLGGSGGGTATFYAAALEKRIYMAVPYCAVCTYEESIMAMMHCSCNHVPGIRLYFEMGDIGCLIAPRKLLIVNGDQDPIFPIEGAKASYEVIKKAYQKLGSEENCRMEIGHGRHQPYPDIIWPIVSREVRIV